MIEELVNDGESEPTTRIRRPSHTRGHFYQTQLYNRVPDSNQQQQTDGRFEEDIRLPWIHKSDPLDFHPSNVLPLVNHVELPLR
jgi:hypothetical protein